MDGRSTDSTKEGRLELCLNDAWGTVCNSSFGYYDAVVACGQLTGFHSQGIAAVSWYSAQFTY